MEIISHRGYWKTVEEKNTEIAFERSFSLGFGTETDLRDYCGELVIAHNIADSKNIPFSRMLEIYKQHKCKGTLAINIKANGLQKKLLQELLKYEIENYFVFDMSVPDLRESIVAGLKCYTRYSEEEKQPSFLKDSDGIWVDSFILDESLEDSLVELEKMKKPLCFVSDELHKRDHLKKWEVLKQSKLENELMLCTDYPEAAKTFFGVSHV